MSTPKLIRTTAAGRRVLITESDVVLARLWLSWRGEASWPQTYEVQSNGAGGHSAVLQPCGWSI